MFRCSLPHWHIRSITGIKDLPLSERLYSTLGGICGYSFLMTSLSFSSSFNIIVAHPDLENSIVNKRWLEELRKYPDLYTIHELYNLYPDWNIDVIKEQKLIETHKKIVLQFPVYWFSCPPLLKKWLDDVFTYGWAYGSQSGYKVKDKSIALAVTAAIREQDYAPAGRYKYSLEEILRPFEITANYVKAQYRPLYAFYGTEYEPSGDDVKQDIEHIEHSTSGYASFIANLS